MRDLNHPDMQWATEVLQSPSHSFTRGYWLRYEGEETYRLTTTETCIQFTRAERDLIVAHLAVLGAF